MELRTLGNTGLKVSVLGYGGAPVGFLATEQNQVNRILNHLLDHGVNLIDTAAMYAGSEEAIGQSIAHRRKDVVLVSKCPNAMTDGADCWSGPKILDSVDRSLRRLKTDHIDVVLLHSCGKDVLERGDALSALLKAKSAGKIGFAGYSGDNEDAAYAATLPGVSVIETSISICDQANLKSVVPIAREKGIGIVTKRPIANGAWRPLSSQQGIYVDYAKVYTERFQAMGLTLADLEKSGLSSPEWPEVALRFTLSQPGVDVAIVGTCKPEHAETNLRAASHGRLPEKTLELIRTAFIDAEARSGKIWRGEM